MKARVSLGEDGLNLNPVDLSPDAWYYEERKGLSIYWDGNLIVVIPWRKVEQSLNHYKSSKWNRGRKAQ